jgi:hypothetical protein
LVVSALASTGKGSHHCFEKSTTAVAGGASKFTTVDAEGAKAFAMIGPHRMLGGYEDGLKLQGPKAAGDGQALAVPAAKKNRWGRRCGGLRRRGFLR